jgi:hypothetical protein
MKRRTVIPSEATARLEAWIVSTLEFLAATVGFVRGLRKEA